MQLVTLARNWKVQSPLPGRLSRDGELDTLRKGYVNIKC